MASPTAFARSSRRCTTAESSAGSLTGSVTSATRSRPQPTLPPTRRPRPRSPPSMYVAYETAVAKPPKPLIKLEKKPSRGKTKVTDPPPNPFPTRTDAALALVGTAPLASPPQSSPRSTIASRLGLRRRDASRTALTGSPSPIPLLSSIDRPVVRSQSPPATTVANKPSHLPTIALTPLPLEKDDDALTGGDDMSISEISRTSLSEGGSSTTYDSEPSASSLGETSFDDDECLTDDCHVRPESALLGPMVFASASSTIDASGSDDGVAITDDYPPQSSHRPTTPVTPRNEAAALDPKFLPAVDKPEILSESSHSRPVTPYSNFDVAGAAILPHVWQGERKRDGSLLIRTERNEGGRGWTGEWNRGDIQAVIKKLRTLK